MNIEFKGKYKSLRDFRWNEIPSLAIITGLNGSGKSQLLELIQSAYQSLAHNNAHGSQYNQQGLSLTFSEIELSKNGVLTWQSRGGYFQFENYNFSYSDLEEIVVLIKFLISPPPVHQPKNNTEENSYTEHGQRGFMRVKHLIEMKKERIISEIASRSGKERHEIIEEDILFHLPEEIIFEDHDIINHDNLDMVFYLYLFRKLSLEAVNKSTESLGIAPWIILNEVLRTSGLPYLFTAPDENPVRAIFRNPINRTSSYRFKIKLVDDKGNDIGLQNLSSGERVILSLAMLLYYFQHRNVRKNLLILDEIDAHLHPSLTKQFFDVVNENLIQQYGARVLMATHSPSTVALAPEKSLFVLQKGDSNSTIKSVSKDSAINLLTAGVPSLSINYENRRQIFVESNYDVAYYDKLYQIIKLKLPEGVSLNFISSGLNGRGNCDQVKEIVNKLNNLGNKSIFGIIDWDGKNDSTRNVRVIGEQKRYSIESFIFDPVLMGFFLWREKILQAKDFNFPDTLSYLDFKLLSQDEVQHMANTVVARIKPKFKEIKDDGGVSNATYENGFTISIPTWYLINYGHDLPTFYQETFPALLRFNKENAFRFAVIENTIADIPGFIPTDLISFMKYFHEIPVHEE